MSVSTVSLNVCIQTVVTSDIFPKETDNSYNTTRRKQQGFSFLTQSFFPSKWIILLQHLKNISHSTLLKPKVYLDLSFYQNLTIL